MYRRTCESSEDSNHSAHTHSLIRIILAQMWIAKDAKFLSWGQGRLKLDCAYESSFGDHIRRNVSSRCGSLIYLQQVIVKGMVERGCGGAVL